MVAMVLVDLTEEGTFTYRQPVLTWVKQHYPKVVTLDVDAASEPAMLGYAQKLLQEARFCVVFLKTSPKQRLGVAAAFIETILQKGAAAAVSLEGEQPQIVSILKARPAIGFHHSVQQNDWQPFLASSLENSLKMETGLLE
ncbi:hypothetical protein TH63_15230 [Rufibacter radiotolerans]|uniref:Uncharacterized protein n=1 Tax=Rufibacter radiotolerans TaxID=1379910 RepID=A0A0H4VSB9_9BACT|nr:hypothetical protein [Rufibacter radiotolerans]AKQ46669.1 hypothetical protein TH63_15230 [Rufibacter radiotolerans]